MALFVADCLPVVFPAWLNDSQRLFYCVASCLFPYFSFLHVFLSVLLSGVLPVFLLASLSTVLSAVLFVIFLAALANALRLQMSCSADMSFV